MVSCFIEKSGQVRPLLPGSCHETISRRNYKCSLDKAIAKGICRIRFFESLTQRVFCIDTGKPLSKKQKESLIEVYPGKVTKLVWSIGNNSGECCQDTGLKLMEILGV